MTMTRDPDRLIRAFLDEGRTELPTHTYDAVRAEIDHTRQRVAIVPRVTARRASFAAIGTAATLLLILGALVLGMIGGGTSIGPGGGPDRAVATVESQVRQQWNHNNDIALTIQRDPTDTTDQYWRVATYDQIHARSWSTSPSLAIARQAGARLLAGRADDVDDLGRRSVTFTVTPVTFNGSPMLSPTTPIEANVATTVSLVGLDGYFARLDRAGTGPYTLTALVAQEGDGPGQWNVADLRGAGTVYPSDVREHYLQVDPAILGPSALALEARIKATAIAATGGNPAPVDYAQAIMRELRSNAYTYDTDVSTLHCETLSTVECFATFKRGFCQYYAPTMAVILRHLGIPTRIVEGFLPGERSGNNEIIRNDSAHTWVEVYFPGRGWVTFDPTGAISPAQLPAALPPGN